VQATGARLHAEVASLAAVEDVEPSFAHAGPGEGKNWNPTLPVAPVRAVFAEWRDAAAPLPVGIKDASQTLAVEPMGVNGCFGDAKNVRLLVLEPLELGVSGSSGEAANTKPPGAAGRGVPRAAGRGAPGVPVAFSVNANMFPAEVWWRGRSPGPNENSAARGSVPRTAARRGDATGEAGAAGAARRLAQQGWLRRLARRRETSRRRRGGGGLGVVCCLVEWRGDGDGWGYCWRLGRGCVLAAAAPAGRAG